MNKLSSPHTVPRTLVLLTNNYPYGSGESFIENEIIYLSQCFEKIYILPFYNNYPDQRTIPANCEVVDLVGFDRYNSWKTLFRHFFTFTTVYLKEFLREKNKRGFFRSRKMLRNVLLQAIFRSHKLEAFMHTRKIPRNSVLYSFWCNDWVTAMCLLKDKEAYRLVTRVHGFDLYHARRMHLILPFRNFQLQYIQAVYCVSDYGRQYMLQHYPKYGHKYFTAPLYVPDRGTNVYEPGNDPVIVSCSNIIPLKRVEYIARALQQINQKMTWIHFGSGTSTELEALVNKMPANITVVLKGQVSNAELMDFYNKQPVYLFVHASSSEGGIPVAIQEAISFGIPVIAADNGGVGEIVNRHTGVLIPEKEFTPQNLADAIRKFLVSEKNTREFRQEMKNYWLNNYSADQKYPLFCEALIKS